MWRRISRPLSTLVLRVHLPPPPSTSLRLPFSSLSDEDAADLTGDVAPPKPAHHLSDEMLQSIKTITAALHNFAAEPAAARCRLEQCSVSLSSDLVAEVLSHLRNDWAAAFTFFLWAGARASPDYAHSVREYHSIIAILAKFRRFDTAWSLVSEMKLRPSPLITRHSLLILIRRYAAVHDVAKAINTFYALKRFGFTPEIDDFHGLLSALCRYKNVEDAEHLLLCNEKNFAFETKSFNIILNGWCNVLVYLREAKRFWMDMERRGIAKDVVSFGCMISCYSKAGNLNDVLKLFDRMKENGILPDRKVYNAVIYALAKGRCMDEAKLLFKTMEETGVAPNAVTFNSLIRPLCKAGRVEDARLLFDEMWQRGLSPSIRTYHAFFDLLRSVDEVFDLLDCMKQTGCRPVIDTYIMLIRKLCRWRQHDSVFKLWNEMSEHGLSPDRSTYIVLIHGLFLNGKLEEAHKHYLEMKEKGFEPEPKTEEMIQSWLVGKETGKHSVMVDLNSKLVAKDSIGKKERGTSNTSQSNFLKQPEARNVTRERGFSLW